jgi:phage tail sheath protein FI
MMARGAMMHGAFHSIAGQKPVGVIGLLPDLTGSELASGSMGSADSWLGDRLSLFGRRYGEFALLSDATTANSRAWQFGGVSRLMGIILRGARHLGQDLMFEPSGPNVWNRLQSMFANFLERLRQKGAFAGVSAADSYSVACDRSTMTQNDIDAGRIIASVMFNPAYPVERITVSLALTEPSALPQKRAA